jgi:hypothetical protein
MSLFLRFFVILFALLISILAAGLALAVGVMLPDFVTVTTDPVEHFMFFFVSFFTTSMVGAYAFLPALALIGIAEAFDIRSIFYYALGGAAIGLLGYFGTNMSGQLEETTDLPPVAFGLQLVAAAGIIAGFVYWLIAGRKAGRWKTAVGAV